MKRKNVIRFKDHARARPIDPGLPPGHRAVNITLPVIRVERFESKFDPTWVDMPAPEIAREVESLMRDMAAAFAPPPAKRERRGVAARRVRKQLDEQAITIETCLHWLAAVAKANPDPRAIAELLDPNLEHYCEVANGIAWLERFAGAWSHLRIHSTRPRTIDEAP